MNKKTTTTSSNYTQNICGKIAAFLRDGIENEKKERFKSFCKLLKTLLQCIGKSESNQSLNESEKKTTLLYGSLINKN